MIRQSTFLPKKVKTLRLRACDVRRGYIHVQVTLDAPSFEQEERFCHLAIQLRFKMLVSLPYVYNPFTLANNWQMSNIAVFK